MSALGDAVVSASSVHASNHQHQRTLFREPIRLNVVAVVVERNHREQKLIMKPQNADRQAAAWKPRSYIAGSLAILPNSPLTAATMHSSGSDSALL